MLPNLASGPQNQPRANVAVSVAILVPGIIAFSGATAVVIEWFVVLSIVFLSFNSSSWLGGAGLVFQLDFAVLTLKICTGGNECLRET